MKWIEIKELDKHGKKTKRWWVKPKDSDETLGYIRWYGRWRKYCFFPNGDTVYEWDCLRDIADFCQEKTKEHKSTWCKK